MSLDVKIISDVKAALPQATPAYLTKLKSISSVNAHIFKPGKKVEDRLDKAINHLTIINLLQQSRQQMSERQLFAAGASFGQAVSLDKKNKVEANVYKKMESLLGIDTIENLGRQVFHAPTGDVSLKIQALDAGIACFQGHWSTKVLADLQQQDVLASLENLSVDEGRMPEQVELPMWKSLHNALIARIQERGVSPLEEDNPDIFRGIVRDFVKVFDNTPESERRGLISTPLFPSKSNPDWMLPLNYIMFTGDNEALNKIKPYLQRSDWLARGPYDSTFVLCIISGMEKNCNSRGNPVACLKELLAIEPLLKGIPNMFGTTPEAYLSIVSPKIDGNLESVRSYGGGGFGGMGKMSTINDIKGGRYNESEGDYENLQKYVKEMRKLLS